MPDESQLARRFKAGDEAALEQVIQRHKVRLARLVFRLTGWHDADAADDIVQETFVAAWLARNQFRDQCSLSTWLTPIAISQTRRAQRKRSLWQKLIAMGVTERSGQAAEAEMKVIAAEQSQLVRAAVQRLPVRDREVIVLYYLEELPVDQIATILGIRRSAVEMRLSRARQRLRQKLQWIVRE